MVEYGAVVAVVELADVYSKFSGLILVANFLQASHDYVQPINDSMYFRNSFGTQQFVHSMTLWQPRNYKILSRSQVSTGF